MDGEKGIFSGPLPIFYALLVYLPFQNYLPSTALGMGINALNLALVALLLSNGASPVLERATLPQIKKLISIFMVYTFASALLNCGRLGALEALVTWKRLYFIPVIFFITYRLIHSKPQIKATMFIVALVTVVSAIQVLRNTSEFSDAHYSDGMRYGGMFGPGGENDLAAFLAINFFWFLFWFQQCEKRWQKAMVAGMAILDGLACLYCFSRGAYIALTVGLIYYAWCRFKALLIVLVLMLATIPVWAPQPVQERIEMLTQQDKLDNDSSAQSRLVIWEGAQKMIAAKPVFGVGPNNFGANIREYAELPEHSPTASHNMYLRMGAELGLPGFLIFVLLLAGFLIEGVRLAREAQGWQSTWAHAFTASIIVVIIVNYFGDRFFREELTGYTWLCVAIACRMRSEIKLQTLRGSQTCLS